MPEVAGDPAALERLRVQRGRLADRMRPRWWYLGGLAVLYGLVFAAPFSSRYLGVGLWPFFVVAVVVTGLLWWGWNRATGIKMAPRDLTSPAAGRPVRIASAVVCLGTVVIEHFLIDRDLAAVAIAVAALAVAAEVVLQRAALRGIREELRAGGGVA